MRKSEDRDWEAFGKSLWIPECGFILRNDLLPVNGFEYAEDEELSLCGDSPWLVADRLISRPNTEYASRV